MPSLRELQLKFAASLIDPAGGYVDAQVEAKATPAPERIGFYRNNVVSNYRATLRAVYPVVERLVGATFFDRAADRYMRVHPSPSGDLNRFGEHFADFVETWPPVHHLPYLADVARLEWCIEESFHAADSASVQPAALATVPPDRQAFLTFDLHPSCRLLVSEFPVLRIWQANQPDASIGAAVDLAEGGEFLLVRRTGHDVAIESVDHGSFCMLSLFAAGRRFEEAWRYADSVQPGFDVVAFLQSHVPGGTFANFDWPASLPDDEPSEVPARAA